MKVRFSVIIAVCLIASLSFAATISINVTPAGDGNVGKDRWGYSGWETVPFNSGATPNYVGHWYDCGDGQSRSTYLQVSLVSLPQAEDISSATFKINILSLQGADTISNLSHAADSSAATGNASDQIGCSEFIGSVTAAAGLGWLEFDVTDMIKSDVQNGYNWAAFMFAYQGYESMTFSSDETPEFAPCLEVVTTAPSVPEPGTMSLLALTGMALLRKRSA